MSVVADLGLRCILGAVWVQNGGKRVFVGFGVGQFLPGNNFPAVIYAVIRRKYLPILNLIFDFLAFVRLNSPVASFNCQNGRLQATVSWGRGVR